jgi:methionine synthase II (cobalamin-independent)
MQRSLDRMYTTHVGSLARPPALLDLMRAADALHVEYAAIVDAGFTLQIDDPFLIDVFSYDTGSDEEKLNTGRRYADAINRGPEEHPPRARAAAHVLRHQRGASRS